MFKINETNRETYHTLTAWVLIASGIFAFFADLFYLRSEGGVGAGTLTYIGEAFTLAGALMGIVQYVGGKFRSFATKNNLQE